MAYHDPYVSQVVVDGKLYESVPLTQEILQLMDALVLVIDHSLFDYDFIVDHCNLILDTGNAIKTKRKNVYKL